jgi:hypothetical protein
MMRLVRRPTRWTFLALALYLAILCAAYRFGLYYGNQERDVWFATPFMLVPFFLPMFARREKRMFWGCFAVCAAHGAAQIALERPPFWDIDLCSFFDRLVPYDPYDDSLTTYMATSIIAVVLSSIVYGLTSVLAAKTYAPRDAAGERGDRAMRDPAKHVHRRYGGLGVPPPNLPPVK